jgi:hypothetical protein
MALYDLEMSHALASPRSRGHDPFAAYSPYSSRTPKHADKSKMLTDTAQAVLAAVGR